jgi:hypothetical protein
MGNGLAISRGDAPERCVEEIPKIAAATKMQLSGHFLNHFAGD